MQGGSFGDKISKSTLIPEDKLTQIISKEKSMEIINNLNTIKDKTNETYESFDQYFSVLKKDGLDCISNYVKENQNQVYTTDDVIEASKKARDEQIAYNTTIQQSTVAFKAASIAKRIFATIGNMGAMWAISKVISVVTSTIDEMVHSEKNLRQTANELGSELSITTSNIEDYKKKIEELKLVINDSTSSFEDVSQARVALMAIQDELIEKFGTEKDAIENITESINGQTNALDELSKKSYYDAKNKFNEKTLGDKFTDWLSYGSTDDERIQSNMDKMIRTMRYSFYELETTGNEALDNLIAKSYGFNIYDDMYGNGKYFFISGTLDDIQDKLYGIQELASNFDVSTGFENSFTKISNDVSDALFNYKNLYDQYILYEKILTNNPDNQYDEQFDLINKAKESYNEAVISGDSDKKKEASNHYAKTLVNAINLATENYDSDVAAYFQSMYPELQQIVGEWKFNIDFEPNTDGLNDKIIHALDLIDGSSDGNNNFSSEDILHFNPNIASQEQIDAYGDLNRVAEIYGLTLEQLLTLLQQMGLVQSESYQQLVNKFGQELVDTLEEDLQYALIVGNESINSWDALIAKIKNYKKTLKDPVSFSDIFSLEDTEGSATTLGTLSKSIDEIQSAYQTLSSAIDEYNENGSFSIDTLQSVMGLGDNWLDYLVDENGTLTLDREALQRLTQARLEDMRVQAVNNLIDNVSKIQNDADANLYLASTNYAAADSFEALAWQSANAAQELLRAKVVSGDLSQENYDAIVAKMGTDINKVNQLFANTDFTGGLSSDSVFGSSNAAGEDTYQELVDFFERRTKVLDNASSLLESNLENVAGSYARNTLVDSQLGIAEERFRNYTDAVSMYAQKASAALAKIPADLAQKVKNGSVSMTDFIGSGNEDVVDAIKDYENWAEKIADCEQELAGLKAAIRQLELDKFNNVMEDFTSQFDIHENANDLIDKQISLFEEAGELIGESFYTARMEESKKQLDLLEQEKAELVDQLNSALSSGRIQAGTDEWLEMVNALSDVDGSILDCKTSMEELDNAILDLHTQIFDRIQEQFSNLNSELENLYGLFDEDADVTDGNRNWTDAAMAQLGLLAQQYELSRYQVQQYDKEIADLNSAYLKGRYSAVEYADKLAGLCSAQWDAVNSAESIKDSIMDLNETRVDEIVDGIQEEIDAYKELADAQIDALKAEKELHDYEASIAEKTKSVTDLEKQLAAMENDTTAATIAKRLRLEEELAQAKKELEDAEYEHSIEAQEEALNQQYEDYEAARNEEITALQESLLNKEAILFQSFETVKQNSAIVGEQIAMTAQQHGITVSNALLSAWASGENAIAGYGAVLSEQSSAFILHIMGIEAETWNLQNQADLTAGTLANMFSARADNLVQQLTDSWYCEDTLNTMTDILHQSLIDTLEGGYDVSSITNALSSITDSANRAAAAFRDLYGTQTSSSGKWYIIDQKTNQVLSRGFKDQNEALSWVPVYAKANGGGTVTVRQFAKGTRNAEGGLRIVNEKGYELVLSKLSSGNYSIGGKGDQILTKEQTDNIFDWAKINPNSIQSLYDMHSNIPKNIYLHSNKSEAPITMNYTVNVDGDVNNSNIKQMEAVVKDGLKKFAEQINRDYRYGRK